MCYRQKINAKHNSCKKNKQKKNCCQYLRQTRSKPAEGTLSELAQCREMHLGCVQGYYACLSTQLKVPDVIALHKVLSEIHWKSNYTQNTTFICVLVFSQFRVCVARWTLCVLSNPTMLCVLLLLLFLFYILFFFYMYIHIYLNIYMCILLF